MNDKITVRELMELLHYKNLDDIVKVKAGIELLNIYAITNSIGSDGTLIILETE